MIRNLKYLFSVPYFYLFSRFHLTALAAAPYTHTHTHTHTQPFLLLITAPIIPQDLVNIIW